MPFNAHEATGVLVMRTGEESRAVIGTCFCFRDDRIALTARHCVDDPDREYAVQFPAVDHRGIIVREVIRHDTADVALLKLDGYDPNDRHRDHAFWSAVSNVKLAEEFYAYGFPDGPFDSPDGDPVPRAFTGTYQRFFDYKLRDDLAYLAGEMSIPAPAGLSGAPVFRPGAHQVLTGLVTANTETYAVTDSFEDYDVDGRQRRVEVRRVISYGLALQLHTVTDWLDEHVPQMT